MSSILNHIKSTVENGVSIEVSGNQQYGNYPVTVKDTTNSVTSGWEMLYQMSQSKFNNGEAFDKYGHFSELRIANFSNLYSLIQQVYSQFKQGVNVEWKYNTNFAIYQPNDTLWFTVLEQKAGVRIRMTVTDETSPFHMLYLNFFITPSKNTGNPYLIGFDTQFNQSEDVFVEKMNAFMLPQKSPYVPVNKQENGALTIEANGMLNQENLVEIDKQQTEIVYLQEISDERKLLAGIYEKNIIKLVLEKATEFFQSGQANNTVNNNSPNFSNNKQNGFQSTNQPPFGNNPSAQANPLGHTRNSFGWAGNNHNQAQVNQVPNPNRPTFNQTPFEGSNVNTANVF